MFAQANNYLSFNQSECVFYPGYFANVTRPFCRTERDAHDQTFHPSRAKSDWPKKTLKNLVLSNELIKVELPP